MQFQNSTEVIKEFGSNKIQAGETNDCTVRAMAAGAEVGYDDAHKFCKEVFKRENRKGPNALSIKEAAKSGELKIGDKTITLTELSKKSIQNKYKLYGEIIFRDKTVKSFQKDFQKGTFLVLVARHAFIVKDGKLIDNAGEEFRPTRKVITAFRIEEVKNSSSKSKPSPKKRKGVVVKKAKEVVAQKK